MTSLRKGISVMPETIYFIGGEAMNAIANEHDFNSSTTAELGFKFMCHLKDHLLTITAQISSIYAQAISCIDIEVAHDLAFEYLYDLAVEVLSIKPKKTQWEMLKEDATLSDSMKAVLKAVETATDEERVALFVIFPNIVEAYLEHIDR